MEANRYEMAEILGYSLNKFDDLRRKEGFPGARRGKELVFDTAEVIQWLLDREGGGSTGDIERQLKLSTSREAAAKASLREIELAERQKVMIRVEDVVEEVENQYAIVKSRLQAIPGRLAQRLAVEEDPATVQQILKEEVAEALDEISGNQWDTTEISDGG